LVRNKQKKGARGAPFFWARLKERKRGGWSSETGVLIYMDGGEGRCIRMVELSRDVGAIRIGS
jgi:hypothetical protein